MGVYVRRKEGKYRLIDERDDSIALSKTGKPVDGGGHDEGHKAERQAAHINDALRRSGK